MTIHPKVSIRSVIKGLILTVENSNNENYPNGEYTFDTIQEAMLTQYEILFPHSASTTLEFLRTKVEEHKR